MAFFEGKGMTGGYGGVDIISSCTINVNKGEIVAINFLKKTKTQG